MAQFKAFSPTAEVLGQAVLSIVEGMGALQSKAVKILGENGIKPLQPGEWYSMQGTLNSFKTIFEKIGPSTVQTIGRKIPEKAQFPPDINSLEAGLRSIDVAYRMNHRGGDFGNYRYESTGPKSATLVCHNPYPCDMDLGLIEGIAERFRPKDAIRVVVQHAPGSCRHRGGESCSYTVTW